jgi:hypothetical protein
MAKVSRKERGEQQERIKEKYGAGSPEHKAAIERTKASVKKTTTKKTPTKGPDKQSTIKAANKAQKKKGNVFFGTNIPTTGFDEGEISDFNARLRADIDDGNWRGANDVIFGIAYSKNTADQRAAGGQGNPSIGAVQSGVWKLTDKDATLWAEDYVNSENDVYRIRDDRGNLTGDRVEFSDEHGVLSGKGATNPVGESGILGPDDAIKSWGGNERAGIIEGQPTSFPTGSGSTSSKSGWVGGLAGTAGETDYLAYRPGSEAYWKSYMGPELTGSLMRMKQPAVTQASLGYLPGEIRSEDSRQMWNDYLGMGPGSKFTKQFQGMIPQGTWRTNPASYVGLGPGIEESGERRPGWQFAAQPSQMIAQPKWTAYDISPQAAGEWTGLLGDWAAPALNTTNLLGVA